MHMVSLMNIRDALRRIDSAMAGHSLPQTRDLQIWTAVRDAGME